MAATKFIDKSPPVPTGDAERDIRAMADYLAYLREQMNYILALQARNGRADREE